MIGVLIAKKRRKNSAIVSILNKVEDIKPGCNSPLKEGSHIISKPFLYGARLAIFYQVIKKNSNMHIVKEITGDHVICIRGLQ